MNRLARVMMVLVPFLIVPAAHLLAAEAKVSTITCVALYSETSDGMVSYRVPKGEWVAVKLGEAIPVTAEIRITVDRDWVEFTPTNDPQSVFELVGSEKGEVLKKVADLLKGKPRQVKFPKVGTATDPAFKDKLVVKQLLGRQVYRATPDARDKDIRYGDVLDIKGRVRIIGINNTLTVAFPNGATTTIIGPLNFEVEKVFAGTNLYKYLNVTK